MLANSYPGWHPPQPSSDPALHSRCLQQVNGQRLQHGTDNFWAWNPGAPIDPSAPLTVALASGRQAVRARVPALRSADLGVQFRSA
jgi:hypothetical protein